jgi:hypothetical protein
MTFTILTILLIFVVVNLAITVLLRYLSANDGWLEYYRRNG